MNDTDQRLGVLETEVRELRNTVEQFRLAMQDMHAQQQKFYHSLQALTNALAAVGRELEKRAGAAPPGLH